MRGRWKYKIFGTLESSSLEEVEAEIRNTPGDPTQWSKKASILTGMDRSAEEVMACHDMALEIDPEYSVALNNKALILQLLGRSHEALECIEKALKRDPKAVTWHNRALILAFEGSFGEAMESIDRALELWESDRMKCMSWKLLSMIYQMSGDLKNALVVTEGLLARDPHWNEMRTRRNELRTAMERWRY